jgi:hypothetical protein
MSTAAAAGTTVGTALDQAITNLQATAQNARGESVGVQTAKMIEEANVLAVVQGIAREIKEGVQMPKNIG